MPFDIDARIDDWKKSLLDTTKRNRLVKFSAGRGGGVSFLHPSADALWQRLVVESRRLAFRWKREILGLPAAEIDADLGQSVDNAEKIGSAIHPGRGPRVRETAPGLFADEVDPGVPPGGPEASTPLPPAAPTEEEGGRRAGPVGAGPLPPPWPKSIRELTAECLDSADLGPDGLLTEFSDKKLAGHLLRLYRTAAEAETDHGISTLYAAFGFLRWYDSPDSQEEIRSPLVLVPVRLERESIDAVWTLRACDDEPVTNHCLAELLSSDFKLRMPTGPDAEVDTEGPDGLAAYLRRVAGLIKTVPRWEVVEEAALGVFNFQKLAMWEDLKKNAERIKGHKLCRAIAGDGGVVLRPPPGLVAAADLDEQVPPEAANHILDADSSQHEAVEAVKRGADVVVDGPPGTGKSQTIANAIAELLAAGKTVLFVSEKTAALEVVKRRLDACGLGDFCLELHSHKANKREVAAELGRCLDIGPEAYRDVSAELRHLADDRRRLNAYAAELHRPRPPLNRSGFEVHGELARLADLPDRSRWTTSNVFGLDAEFLRRATAILAGLTRCRPVVENPTAHPWRGCRLATVTQAGLDDARHHLDRVAVATARLDAGTALADLALEGPTDSVARWREAVGFARSVLAVPPTPAGWFAADPLAAATAAGALHGATTRVRLLAGPLAGFDPGAVWKLTPDAASALVRGVHGSRELLAGGSPLPARRRVDSLRSLGAKLAAVSPVLDRLADAFGRLLSALRISGREVTVAQVRKYAEVAARLAEAEPVRPAWWDAGRRAEVRGVASKAIEDEAAAQGLRVRLAVTFAPAAFAPDAGPVVGDALHHGGSFWRRLFSRWGDLRRGVTAWYAGPTPGRGGLLADLGALAEFHRRAGYARQVEAGYAADLVMTPAGRADWAATTAGLGAVERYEKWKLPAELKAALAPNGGLDRAALARTADEVTRVDADFQDAWAGLLTSYAPADPAPLSCPAGELAARLRTDATAAGVEAEALERLTGLLPGGRDLPPGTWAARSAELAELAGLRSRIAAHAGLLGLDGSAAAVEATDWSAVAVAAGGLRAFLARTARPSPATVAALCDEVVRARLRRAVEASEKVVGDGFEESWAYVAGHLFPADVSVSDGPVLGQTPVPELSRWARSRSADLNRLEEWVRYGQIRREASALGIEAVVDQVCAGQIRPDRAADAFRRRFLGLWLDALYEKVPELAAFAADEHDDRVERFIRLDRLAIRTAPARLRSRLLTHPHRPHADGAAPTTSELGILLREANKKRKHLPLRRLFAEVPTLLPRLKPCLMMSPLAVSTYLNSPALTFDVVIFDEASQVRPHDAICAIYRGRQLVVAGDPRQLPPSDFFARSAADDGDADDGGEGTAGFESLLDVCLSLGLVRKQLRWHYRSRREGLIAFSNKFFYDGGLVTFPSVDDGSDPAVRLVRVPDGRFEDGVNVPEARRAAELVIAHFRTSPARSLGVIAFSQRQQNQVLDELEVLRRANPDLEDFFKADRPERFFVKNLENVQGDERDAIVLSVGYGPTPAGKMSMSFGPLNRQGGERRLNVAVTRSRTSMTVVASMTAADVDLSRTQAEGARLLRAFLDYADRGPRALAEAVTAADAGDFDSPFERAVFEELGRRGLTLHKQVGCGGFKIDMAVVDPAAGGRYLLGVECDGATYHSSATARDRDRLRQGVLEGLGWRLCRIWSTDWLRNRDKQVRRVLSAMEETTPLPKAPAVDEKPPAGDPAPGVPATPAPPPPPSYEGIDAVPELVIRTTALALIIEYGATEPEDLCGAVSRRLGFKKLGKRIKARVESSLADLARERKLERQGDGRWGATSKTAG